MGRVEKRYAVVQLGLSSRVWDPRTSVRIRAAPNFNMKYPQLILRIGLGVVFFYFGIMKFFNPVFWTSFIPVYIENLLPISINLFLYIQGLVEVIIGLALIFGFYTRLFSFLTASILFVIMVSLGFNDVTVRDFGLFMMAVSLIISGAGELSLDNKIKSKKSLQKDF